jgi:hypothetical protein
VETVSKISVREKATADFDTTNEANWHDWFRRSQWGCNHK